MCAVSVFRLSVVFNVQFVTVRINLEQSLFYRILVILFLVLFM
jgi:hypothetical protein